ncbi:hypothetical protein [Saccharothrix luteola]|uniref:hypothetical protein n=1 Tax=Saccharothrix luteola TaxID=2893018 RepID=UPI001E4C9A36|nr:hypothetical protein [Saccharothrix luteola]MCC8244984.1 hypothetical protein [Saccharothrix luteola]
MAFEVDESAVADFGRYLGAEAGYTLPTIETLARDEGMSDHGFTGVLEPLGEIVNGPASLLVGSAFSLMQRKLCDLGDSVRAAAKDYGHVDDRNTSLFEYNKLNGDTNQEITFGADYGYADYTADGHSKFQCTKLDIGDIDRPDTKYSDDLKLDVSLKVLDWIWSEFNVDGGKGFTDSLISPLAGNYNSISANGEAWQRVGANLGLLAENLLHNGTTLATGHWRGDAAVAFTQFLDVFWKKGAVWAGEQLGKFVAAGFDKIAEVSKSIAQTAINAIEVILRAARRIATKALPVVGWAWTAVESIGKWLGKVLGIDIDDLIDDIKAIVEMVPAVLKLFDALRNMADTMRAYFNTLEELVDTVARIPEIDSLSDAVATAGSIEDGATALNEQKKQLEQDIDKADDSLTQLDQIAEKAGK